MKRTEEEKIPLRNWKRGEGGELEEAIRELENSEHALREAVGELRPYSEPGDFRGLHFTQGVSAIQLAEQRILVAKRKLLASSEGKEAVFSDPNMRSPYSIHSLTQDMVLTFRISGQLNTDYLTVQAIEREGGWSRGHTHG